MSRLLLTLMLSVACSGFAAAPSRQGHGGLQAEFVLSRGEGPYFLGEPILGAFIVRNDSKTSGWFTILRGPYRNFSFTAKGRNGNLVRGLDASLPSGECGELVKVAAGEVFRRQIILNEYLAFEVPDTYLVSCEYEAPSLGGAPPAAPAEGHVATRVTQKFEVVLRKSDLTKVAQAADRLSEQLGSADQRARADAIRALAYVEGVVAKPHLAAALKSPCALVRVEALRALGRLGGPTAIDAVLEVLKTGDEASRAQAASTLGQIGQGNEQALGALYELVKDRNRLVRLSAAIALGQIGGEDALGHLRPLLDDAQPEVRNAAAEAMKAVTTKPARGPRPPPAEWRQ